MEPSAAASEEDDEEDGSDEELSDVDEGSERDSFCKKDESATRVGVSTTNIRLLK